MTQYPDLAENVRRFRGEIFHHRRNLRVPGESARKVRETDAAWKWCDQQDRMIATSLSEVQSGYTTAYERWHGLAPPAGAPPRPSCTATKTFRMAEGIALLGECTLGASLAIHALLLPAWSAAAFGIGMTLALYYGSKTALDLLTDQETKPQQSLVALKKLLVVLTAGWLGAILALLLLPRVADLLDAAAVKLWLGGAFTLLTIVSPVLAATIGLAAGLRGWANPHAKAYSLYTQCANEVRSLRSEISPRLVTVRRDDEAA